MIDIKPSEKAKNVKYAIRNIVRFAKELEKKGILKRLLRIVGR